MKLHATHRHVPVEVTVCIAPLVALTSRCFGRRYVWSYAKYCRGHVT